MKSNIHKLHLAHNDYCMSRNKVNTVGEFVLYCAKFVLDGIEDFCRKVVHAVHWGHIDLWQEGDDFRVDDKDQTLTTLHNLKSNKFFIL